MPVPETSDSQIDPQQFGCAITSITVGDGQPLKLIGSRSVVAIVGSNNVGKSTLLREISTAISKVQGRNQPANKVLSDLVFDWNGDEEVMVQWVNDNAKYNPDEVSHQFQDPLGQLISSRNKTGTPGRQWQWFINQQSPTDRIKICDPVERPEFLGAIPTHPFHRVLISQKPRDEAISIARKLFQQDLTFDNISRKVGFNVGKVDVSVPLVDEVTNEYAEALAALPRLHEQGDGMRSALGLLIPLIADPPFISLIDEPEAFLHPPQARTLGTQVGTLAKGNDLQVILATHDRNFLQGLVESEVPVSIIYLTREDNVTTAKILESDRVKELWEDPVLRYGNALDGLFHSAVIVTENDRDSQFYEASIDHALSQKNPDQVHNLMFLASHGKTNICKIVERLSSLGVRTVSSPDLDILNDKEVLRRLVEAHGGDWQSVDDNYRKATNQFRNNPKPSTVASIRAQIADILDQSTELNLTRSLARDIQATVAISSPWKALKTVGDRAFSAEKTAATNLLRQLDEIGIVSVRVGELERFLTTADASKGSGFLKVAFEEGAHKTEEARKHAERLLTASGYSLPQA